MDKRKKWLLCLAGILLIWAVTVFKSSPLSERGKISLEDFVYCRIQVIELIDDAGRGRAVIVRDMEMVEKLTEEIEELKVRKSLPWEKIHTKGEEPYTFYLQFDSEEAGGYESINFWKNGEVFFRGNSYMIAGENKIQMTDRLEWLLQNYKTEE